MQYLRPGSGPGNKNLFSFQIGVAKAGGLPHKTAFTFFLCFMKSTKSVSKTASAKSPAKAAKPVAKPVAPLKKVVAKPEVLKAASAKPAAASKIVKAGQAAKPAAKTPAKSKAVKAAKPAKQATSIVADSITISNDDIALRAYFIAERRHKMGWPGDSSSDWIEAERQLRQEAQNAAKLAK